MDEKTENVGIKTPVTKKKVRVVKKIVKKKIIKKVPKPRVLVASNCNDLEKVTNPNPSVNSSTEIKIPNVDIMEIEKPDVDIGGLKEVDNVKELELGDQIHNKLEDSDRFELQDSGQDRIELQDNDQNPIELQEIDQNLVELQDGGQNRIESQDNNCNLIELHDSDQNQSGLQNNDQNGSTLLDVFYSQFELQNHDKNGSALQDSDENQVELVDGEDDTNRLNVKEVMNSETDGLKSHEAVSESEVSVGKTVVSRLHLNKMKKIFVHGLGQETKEEDIRKVFEEVGEVVNVKLIVNFRSGKNRGFGFITFASADLANLALTKYQNVEICGRPCHTSAIEGIDTILLKNIDKKWNKEHVVEFLQKISIKKIDEVSVLPNPDNAELNCGFVFIDFETKKDAQMAYLQLQNEIVSGNHSNLEVSWASSSVDPVEEEIHNNKSVYAENIPLSWDEKEVNDHFKTFGEIESIALAKNLRTAKRNDFAFINYKTCEAAHSCIEALTCQKSNSNNGPKGHLKVSLAKSIPKVKPVKPISDSARTEVSQPNQSTNRSRKFQSQHQNTHQSRQSQQNSSYLGVYKPSQKPTIMAGKYEDFRKDSASSTTAELVQLLREQASWKQGGPSSTRAHHQPPFGGKQPFNGLQGSKSLYHHDPRAYHQSHLQIPNVTHHRPIANVTSFPHHDQQRVHHASGSLNFTKPDPRYFQTKDQTTYPGSSSAYRQRR